MAGQLFALDGLPGRYASVRFDPDTSVIEVSIDDADGNLKGRMAWHYAEPVETPDPSAPVVES